LYGCSKKENYKTLKMSGQTKVEADSRKNVRNGATILGRTFLTLMSSIFMLIAIVPKVVTPFFYYRANLVIEPIVSQHQQQLQLPQHQSITSQAVTSSTPGGVTITALKSQPVVTTSPLTDLMSGARSLPTMTSVPATARVVRVLQSSRAGNECFHRVRVNQRIHFP